MAKVYVTHEVAKFDYTAAREYGEVDFLTASELSYEANSIHNVGVIEEVRRNLSKYDPANDYILISGAPAVMAVVFMILREKTAHLRMLRWSKYNFKYELMVLNVA